jgi:hypothetical protein
MLPTPRVDLFPSYTHLIDTNVYPTTTITTEYALLCHWACSSTGKSSSVALVIVIR